MDKAKKTSFRFKERTTKKKKKETLLFTLLYLFSFRALHLIIITL